MAKFAKLFDVEDTQVLAMVTDDSDGEPSLRFTTEINSGEISMAFRTGEGPPGWEAAQAALEKVDQQMAEDWYKEMIAKWGGGVVAGLMNGG